MRGLHLPGIDLRKLAIVQIVLGILVVGSFFAFVSWVSTGYHVYEGTIPSTDIIVRMHLNPGQATLFETWQYVYFVMGLVVIGCGLAQFIKARRQATVKGGELGSGDESRKAKV